MQKYKIAAGIENKNQKQLTGIYYLLLKMNIYNHFVNKTALSYYTLQATPTLNNLFDVIFIYL